MATRLLIQQREMAEESMVSLESALKFFEDSGKAHAGAETNTKLWVNLVSGTKIQLKELLFVPLYAMEQQRSFNGSKGW